MWDLPGPGIEPVSPALAGRFLSTAPPGKPKIPFGVDFEPVPAIRILPGGGLKIERGL